MNSFLSSDCRGFLGFGMTFVAQASGRDGMSLVCLEARGLNEFFGQHWRQVWCARPPCHGSLHASCAALVGVRGAAGR